MELESLLADEQLANAPILILGNKIDKIGAAGEGEIRNYFNLHGKTTGQVRFYLFDVV
jgi:GTP-binding protein SAR1